MSDSRAKYLAETDPAAIKSAYNHYNRDYRWAWGTGVIAGVVYLAAQVDLIRLESRQIMPEPHAALIPVLSAKESQLVLRYSW
jgi:hypothetical protein